MKSIKTFIIAFAAVMTAVSCQNNCKEAEQACTIGIVPNPCSQVEYSQTVSADLLSKVKTSVSGRLETEAYVLTVSKKGVKIVGGSQTGVYWGLQTLEQIKAQVKDGLVPCMKIEDAPAFPYRGSHLDCSRTFFSVDEIKQWIDMIALHKINYFHWHLTDDQGWRLEIKKYPLLTEIGSVRAQTLVGHYGDKPHKFDGKPYGGFYTQEEAREIVEYAAQHHIQVIPEIEMPGHSVEVLTAYPEFGCTGGPYKVREIWGISTELMCMAKPEVMTFLKDVLDEVMDIFPCEYVNIGGDECPTTEWEQCDNCHAFMAEHGFTKEREMQYWLVGEMEKYIASKGRKMIGWQEIYEGCTLPETSILSWLGAEAGVQAATKGMHTVMCPYSHCYLDYYQTEENIKREPLAIGGYLPLETVYSFDPLAGVPEDKYSFVSGIQGNVWCEYIPNFAHAQHMALPRLAAIAELGWSGNAHKTSYEEFRCRMMSALLPIYKEAGYNYAPYAFED